MAALQNIRNHAGFLITIIAVALGAFVIGDFLTSTSSIVGRSKSVLGEVDGEELSIIDFQQQEKEFSEVVKSLYQGRQTPSSGEMRDAVWNKFVTNTLLDREMESVGLTVTDEEVSDAVLSGTYPVLRQVPIFYRDGKYDPTIVPQFIAFINQSEDQVSEQNRASWRESKDYWKYWENQIKTSMKMDKLYSLLLAATTTPKKIVDIENGMQSEQKDVIALRKMFSQAENVDVSDEDARRFYEENKEAKYKTEGYREVEVAVFSVRPSEEDFKDTEAAANELREQMRNANEEELAVIFSDASSEQFPYKNAYRSSGMLEVAFNDFAFGAAKDSVSDVKFEGGHFMVAKVLAPVKSAPDSANVSMIVLAAKDKEELAKQSDSLMAVLNAGEKFEEVSAKHSIDKQIAEKGGEIGWICEGSNFAVSGFDEKVFGAKKGDIVVVDLENNPVRFIVKINDLTAPVKKANIAVLGVKLEASNNTYNDVYTAANKFVIENNTLTKFQAAADSQHIMLRSLGHLAENQHTTYIFPDSREIIKWAWQHEVGDVSGVFEMGDVYVVAVETEAVEAGYIPFTNNLVKEECQSMASIAANAKILSDAIMGESWEGADTIRGVRFGNNYMSRIGNEPALVGAIAASETGKQSEAVVGDLGVYRYQVLSSNASSDQTTVESENRRVYSHITQNMVNTLKKEVEIVDNRSNFY